MSRKTFQVLAVLAALAAPGLAQDKPAQDKPAQPVVVPAKAPKKLAEKVRCYGVSKDKEYVEMSRSMCNKKKGTTRDPKAAKKGQAAPKASEAPKK